MSTDVSRPPAVQISDLGYETGGSTLLHGVSLTASAGELLALVGPNGAGKSTLLALAAGDLRPTTGRVLIGGHRPQDWSARALARQRAVMTQHHSQAFSFTVRETVAMGRSPHPVSEDDAQIVDQALSDADMAPLAGRDVTTLSGGELARTVFARVLAQEARVVLLDEPTAALDLHHQEVLMDRARTLTGQGRCVIVVLHDLTLAARYCDRVAVLDTGRLAAVGPPAHVLTPERIAAVYRHDVVVLSHPVSGKPLVVPV